MQSILMNQYIKSDPQAKFQQLEMILDLKAIRGYSFPDPLNSHWYQEFAQAIVAANKPYLADQAAHLKKEASSIDSIDHILEFIHHKSSEPVAKLTLPSSPHSFYSSFVPVRIQNYKWMNQFQKEYPILTYLDEQGYQENLANIENQLLDEHFDSADLKFRMNPQFSMIDRAYLWSKVLQQGTGVLEGKKIDMTAWSYSLSQANDYITCYTKQVKLRHNLQLTVQTDEMITQESISRTMKNLYCPVCLLYDCLTHEAIGGNVQYVSLANKISQQKHLSKAIHLVSDSQKAPEKIICKKDETGEGFEHIQNVCSPSCFKGTAFKTKSRGFSHFTISPLAKSIIELGINLYSFEPCMILKLFKPSEIKCFQIYEYLVNECGMFTRIQNKFYLSEEELLLNESEDFLSANNFPITDAKKKKKKSNKAMKGKECGKSICMHHFVNQLSQDIDCRLCDCRKRGFCLPECLCSPACPLLRSGCKCKEANACRNNKCLCFKNHRECNPSICKSCCGQDKISCRNLNIQRNIRKNIRIGISKIPGAGLGAFAGESINKQQLVTIYLGEEVDGSIEQMRHSTTRDSSFYNFDINGLTLDARFIGNKARFINHGDRGTQNLRVQILQSQGEQWICFFAMRDIAQHEELYFDYDGTGELAKHHCDKYPFIGKKK